MDDGGPKGFQGAVINDEKTDGGGRGRKSASRIEKMLIDSDRRSERSTLLTTGRREYETEGLRGQVSEDVRIKDSKTLAI